MHLILLRYKNIASRMIDYYKICSITDREQNVRLLKRMNKIHSQLAIIIIIIIIIIIDLI